jgi:Kyakuja-Dileera-Zisupton transposase
VNGRGTFPDDKVYRTYISNAGDSVEVRSVFVSHCKVTAEAKLPFLQKSTCAHLKVVNMQDKIKFRSMDITGVVSTTCRHIFVLSTVDLQKGER